MLLNEFNIKSSILDMRKGEKCPYWLIKWVSLICNYVKMEHDQLLIKKNEWQVKEDERLEKLKLHPKDPKLQI